MRSDIVTNEKKPNTFIGFLLISTILTIIIEFLLDPATCNADILHIDSTGYVIGGGAECQIKDIYGFTAKEVGEKLVEMNNEITTLVCSQRCRNPVSLYNADENSLTVTVQSLCGGSLYTYPLHKDKTIINENEGPPPCPPGQCCE